MLTIIPPKSTSEVYCGVTSNHSPARIITKFVEDIEEISKTNSVIESSRIEAPCMLDEAGCITTDFSKAKSILYQEVKDGKIVTLQEPVSDIDREIAELWRLIEEVDKGIQERELMRQKINADPV